MIHSSRHPRGPQNEYGFTAAVVLAFAIVGAGLSSPSGGGGIVSAQALNPCTLLTPGEVQSLSGKESVPDGVPSSLEALGSMTCRYAWGIGADRFKLDVVVNDASRMFPGMSPDQIKQRLLQSVRAGTADAAISDVGEAAVFRADSALYAGATAISKGRILEVQADGFVAREKKDQVIALLKSAVSRL
jgi:hypothetical protein